MIRVGLIGAGFIAREHARAYAAIDGVEVVAVAAPHTAEPFVAAHAPDAVAVADVEALRETVDPDIVDVCTPTPTHRAMVEACADLPATVVCEKPLARTLADAAAVAPVVDLVGHVVRHDPAYRTVREQVAAEDVGVARARRVGPPPDWADWYADTGASGGVLLDLAIHDLDFLRWTIGPVERVFARHRRWDAREHAVVTLRFETGAVAHVEASWAQPATRPFTSALEVATPGGLVEYDGEDPTGFRQYAPDEATRSAPVARDAMHRQLAHAVAIARDGVDPAVTPADAIDAMRLSLAAIESADTDEPVRPEAVSP